MRYLRTSEVAAVFGVGAEQVRRWVRSGLLEACKLGQEWRIGDDVLQVFIQSHMRRPSE